MFCSHNHTASHIIMEDQGITLTDSVSSPPPFPCPLNFFLQFIIATDLADTTPMVASSMFCLGLAVAWASPQAAPSVASLPRASLSLGPRLLTPPPPPSLITQSSKSDLLSLITSLQTELRTVKLENSAYKLKYAEVLKELNNSVRRAGSESEEEERNEVRVFCMAMRRLTNAPPPARRPSILANSKSSLCSSLRSSLRSSIRSSQSGTVGLKKVSSDVRVCMTHDVTTSNTTINNCNFRARIHVPPEELLEALRSDQPNTVSTKPCLYQKSLGDDVYYWR